MENNLKHIENLISAQLKRIKKIKENQQFTDFKKLDKIVIGTANGDGIGPVIMDATLKVLKNLLTKEISSGKIEIREIEGLTIENRVAKLQAVPDDVLSAIRECNVLLKGPTTTPGKKDNLPNIESANVTLRKELDLFANVRPVKVPEKNIDWIFFRENTEGEYALGSQGIEIDDEIAVDFKIITDVGTRRIAEAAFNYAKSNGNLNVSIITKANIMKKTDGKFLEVCYDISKKYPEIKTDDWYVDICAANLINPALQSSFNVFLLPNLYGDIITDEAAQLQGGVGTAGSANIGSKYAMFEAVHGSAPRMVKEGISKYASPASLLKASEMMLRHVGYTAHADKLESLIELANNSLNMSGDGKGNTAAEFADFINDRC
jgi:Isocitrate/isopropylmalate dehydrogenase